MQAGKYNHSPSPLSSLLLGAVTMSAILLAALPGGNLINLGLSVAFVGVVSVSAIAGKRALWFSPEILILVAWLCFSMIGTLFAVDTNAAMFKSLTMVQVLVLAFCVQQVVIWNRGNNANLVVYGIAVSISYLFTFTGYSAQEIAGAEQVAGDVGRVASTLNDENTFGAVALMAVSFALIALAQNTRKAAVLPLGLLLIVLFIAVVNSGSRTAFLGAFLVAVGSIWAFRMWRGANLSRFAFTGLGVLIVSVAVLLVAKSIPEVEDRIEAVFSADSTIATRVEGFFGFLATGDTKADEGDSIGARVSMINQGLEVVANNPVKGVGLDNFRAVTGAGTYAHSNLIEVATSTGLIGFLIYHLMYVVVALRILRLTKSVGTTKIFGRLALVGLMAYFLMDITRVSYYEKTSWLYFAIIGALAEVHHREAKALFNKGSHAKKRRRKKRRKSDVVIKKEEKYDDIDKLFSGEI